jgi:hypothetical protein
MAGGGSAYVDGNTIRVTVEWSQQADPVVDQDFSVDFTNQSNPVIELIEGDLGWRVESIVRSTGIMRDSGPVEKVTPVTVYAA